MKRLLVGALCLLSLGQIVYSDEVVTNSFGEEVILLSDGRWMTKERVDEIRAFEEKVAIEVVKVNPKRNRYRTTTIKITNNSDKNLTYVAYGIKFKFGEEYSLRKIIAVNNLPSGESTQIERQISVQDIEGREIKVDVIDFNLD